MAGSAVSFCVQEDGVAIISINNPPKNTLNNNVMSGLQMRFQEAHARTDVRAIVLTATGNNFSFGVDLSLFQHIQRRGCEDHVKFVPAIPFMTMIEDGPKPVVAALRGHAIGASLEMTLACHGRVADSTARFSVPDFHNGIIPGLGGTQRVPRLVGMKKALDFLIWAERPWTASEALEAGLIDEVTSTTDVLQKACLFALDIIERKFPWVKSLERTDRLEQRGEALQILRRARFQCQKAHPNLVHPLLCIDVMEEGLRKGGLAGAILEEQFCHGLVNTSTARGLMHVFFARRLVAKMPIHLQKGLQPRKVKRIAVIGCGPTGAAIATAFLLSKIPTILRAESTDELQVGLTLIEDNIENFFAKWKIPKPGKESLASFLTIQVGDRDMGSVDLVVEASDERAQNRYEAIRKLTRKSCYAKQILATTSSCVDLTALSSMGHGQCHIIGMHFMSPAYSSELVELSYAESTSHQVLVDVLALLKQMKKLPLLVKSSPGVVVDCLWNMYLKAISLLTELGVHRCQIYTLLKGFGMDENMLMQVGTERAPSSDHSLSRMSFIEDEKILCPLEEDAVEMVLFPVVSEAYRILFDGMVAAAEHIDIASILGMGFPHFRGGLLFWADWVGMDHVASQLTKWASLYGAFFRPCPQLSEVLQQSQQKVHAANQNMARL